MKKHSLYVFSLLGIIFVSSCVSYHSGMSNSQRYPGVRYITVANQTRESELSIDLKRSFTRELRTRPGLGKPAGMNGLSVTMTITDASSSSIATAEIRDRFTRNKKSDEYQTVLNRLTIKVKYKIIDKDGKLVIQGNVTGTGDIPRMHDQNVGVKNALALAAQDAAKKIVSALNDVY